MKNPFKRRTEASESTPADTQAAALMADENAPTADPTTSAASTRAADTTTQPTQAPVTAPVPAAALVTTSRPDREVYALHKSRWILRAITFLCEFIAFFIVVGLAAECASQGPGYCSPFMLFFVGVPMLWNIAEFITLCINRKGIHPGAHIAADLIAFGFLVGPASTAAAVWAYDFDYNDCDDTNQVCSRPAGYRGRARSRLPSVYTSLAFMMLAGILHFVLFILACIAVHKWRMKRDAARLAQMQALYNNRGMAFGSTNMDPNQAYLVTYPDGRQVLVPPANPVAAQQYQQMTQSYGYYGAHQQQQPQPPPQMQQASNTQLPIFSGHQHHHQQQQQQQPQMQPKMQQASNTQLPLFPHHQHHHQQQQQEQRGENTGLTAASAAGPTNNDRDSLYEPKSAIEPPSAPQPSSRSSPRPGEAVPFRNL